MADEGAPDVRLEEIPYLYIYTHTYTCIYMCIYMYTYKCLYIFTYIYISGAHNLVADEGAPDFLLVEVPEQKLAVVAPRHRLQSVCECVRVCEW